MEKRPLVIGNWKMELSHKAEIELLRAVRQLLKGTSIQSEVVVCPSFPSLAAVKAELAKSKKIALGAQNVFWQERGAWTGQVSITQIKPFVAWCLVGHSEARAVTGVGDEDIVKTAVQLLQHSIRPVVCIGETAPEREADQTIAKIHRQAEVLLASLDRAALLKTVIAYEPIWAIGTGQVPTSEQVTEVVLLLRKHIAARHDQELAERVTILYGGSVKADLVANYVSGPAADGVLVGGASIHPKQFVDIIKNVDRAFA